MYQVDADFTKILDEVTVRAEHDAPEEDFFSQLDQGEMDYQGPLFGETVIPSDTTNGANPSDKNSPKGSGQTNAPNQNLPVKPLSGRDYYGSMTAPPPDEQQSSSAASKKVPPSIEF